MGDKRVSPGRLLHGADYNYEQWLDRPEILDEDFALMKRAGCSAMTVGIFSWAKYEKREGEYDFEWMDRLLDRLHAVGIRAILSTPTGSKPAWLSAAYPETCRMDVHGHRERHGYRHNHCRSSAVYREKCAEINARLAERYGKHPALALWHVNNEYNAGRCYCPACLAAFRAWLRSRYGTLDALNAAWWTSFWSHTFGDWEEIFPADSSVNGLMLDWARFTSDQTIDFYLAESRPLREITPDIPITTNFQTPDVGIDYFEFARHVDVVSWNSYPRWHASGDDAAVACRDAFFHDLYRAAKDAPFLLMESTPSCTNWQGVSPLKRPNVHALAALQAVAHGSDSVLYFQWRQSRGGEEKFHGAVVSHFGSDTRVFSEVSVVGDILGRLSFLSGSPIRAEVAVVYDFQNGWALDLAQLPRSVEKRYQEECVAHYSVFWRRGIAADVVGGAARDFSRYKLVVVPMLYMLRADTAEALSRYVSGGGKLVVTYLTGLVDESDLCFPGGAPGPLAALLGLRVEETDAVSDARPQSIRSSGDGDRDGDGALAFPAGSFRASHYADILRLEGAEVAARYEHDFLAGLPAVTRHPFGKGAAWYLATRTETAFLDAFYGRLIDEADVESSVPFALPLGVAAATRGTAGSGAAPTGAEGLGAARNAAGTEPVTFVLNFTDAEVSIDMGGARYRDALSREEVPGRLKLEPYGFRLLTCADVH